MGRRKKDFTALMSVPLRKVIPPQTEDAPGLNPEAIVKLAARFEQEGQREPLLLQQTSEDQHIIVSGRLRFLAAKHLKWKGLDSLVLDATMNHEVEVIQRLQGGNYNPWELADVLQTLKDKLDWTQAHLGAAIDKSRDFVANILALTQITPEARKFILSQEGGDRLTARHLRYVARTDPKHQIPVATKILSERLSTTRLERESHATAPKTPTFKLMGVREPLPAEHPDYPATLKEWKKYYRRLNTDLLRISRQEAKEMARTKQAISEARMLQQQVKKIAGDQRKRLEKELRQARKLLLQQGGV